MSEEFGAKLGGLPGLVSERFDAKLDALPGLLKTLFASCARGGNKTRGSSGSGATQKETFHGAEAFQRADASWGEAMHAPEQRYLRRGGPG